MSYPGGHEDQAPSEETLLHSSVIAEQLARLQVVAKAMRSSSDPTLVRLAGAVTQHCGLLSEELEARGDQLLIPHDEEPTYEGSKAIYIEGVVDAPPYPRRPS